MQTLLSNPVSLVNGTIFNANIFFPATSTLAYSDHLLLQSLVLAPLYAVTRDVVLCYNVLLLASLVTSALAMKLVGSPISFIRGPFVAEGVLQGGLGALIAIGLLWAGFAVVRAWWGGDLSAVLDGAAIQFLPVRLVGLLVAGAMSVGAAGGFAASRHAA